MSSSTALKCPIPRIPTAKIAKKRGQTLVERTVAKRETERARNKTRVNIGVAYERWRELRDLINLKSDAEMATFLIDSFEKGSNIPTPYMDVNSGQSPPPRSSNGSQCLRDDYKMAEENELENNYTSPIEELEVSIDCEDEEPDSEPDRADSDCEGVAEEQNIDTGGFDTDSGSEGVDNNADSDDPEYTPGMCEQEAAVRQKRLSSAGVKKEEDSRLPQPEHSSSHEQTEERPPEAPTQYEGLPRPKKTNDCLTCGKVLSSNEALQRHLVIHSGQRPFKCFICGKGFTQAGNLKTHMKVHKGEVHNWTLLQEKTAPKESPILVNICGECGMDFPQKEQLEEHRQSHKKPYACPDCSMTFKHEFLLKSHKLVHFAGAFICSECGKSFMTYTSLKKHIMIHSGKKNFRCKQCGKTFSKALNLKLHLKTHTGERPHLCSVCGKSYSKKEILKAHLRVHTGEKPYTCEKCGKSFVYCSGYQRHLKNHNKKPKPPTYPLGRPKQQQLVVNDR